MFNGIHIGRRLFYLPGTASVSVVSACLEGTEEQAAEEAMTANHDCPDLLRSLEGILRMGRL